jgi:DNA-binding Lrp family transcriptional regulator
MLNDRQLSSKIGVRMSTLNAIKNKMKRRGLIKDRIVPNVEIMDYELLSVVWAPLERMIQEEDDRRFLRDLFKDYPHTYTAMVFGDTIFYLSMYRNFTQLSKTQFSIENNLKKSDLLKTEKLHHTIHPISLSALNKNFDYTAVLERAFDIEPSEEPGDPFSKEIDEEAFEKIHNLTNKEKTILKGILRGPDMPDNKIAKMLDTTRQAVARHKKELLKLGVIKKVRIIDYKEMGFNILCLVEAYYNKKENVSSNSPNTAPYHLPSFFAVYGNMETVSLSLFKDFEQFNASRKRYTSLMREFCSLIGEPHINLYSPADAFTIKHQEYLPLVEEFLKTQ